MLVTYVYSSVMGDNGNWNKRMYFPFPFIRGFTYSEILTKLVKLGRYNLIFDLFSLLSKPIPLIFSYSISLVVMLLIEFYLGV